MPKILVVDDQKGIRDLLSEALEKEGFEVVTASSGKEAIDIIHEDFFDLVITDLVMPEQENIETIMELKRRFIMPERQGVDTIMTVKDNYPEAKIIAISGGSMGNAEELLEKVKKLGVYKTFAKPFSLTELIKVVKEVVL